jgi:DNA-binding winged helix-turn-helix (wHTH) protein
VEAFQVGPWRVDPVKCVLAGNGHRVRVEPKAMRVLVYLAERAGEDVPREEILRAVWEGSMKAEVLTNAIWELRKAFGDDPREPDFIQTVSRKGYRLVARVVRGRRPGVFAWLRSLLLVAVSLLSAGITFAQTARVGGKIADAQAGVLGPYHNHTRHTFVAGGIFALPAGFQVSTSRSSTCSTA